MESVLLTFFSLLKKKPYELINKQNNVVAKIVNDVMLYCEIIQRYKYLHIVF